MSHMLSGFLDKVEEIPHADALVVDDKVLSYQQLYDQSMLIQSIIQSFSIDHKHPRCAILSCRTESSYTSLIASTLVGYTYVPLNPSFPLTRTLDMLAMSDARVLLIDSCCEGMAEDLLMQVQKPLNVVFVDLYELPQWCYAHSFHRFFSMADASDINQQSMDLNTEAYLLFTSGTTGQPKAIVITHDNVSAYLNNIQRLYDINSHDRCTQLFDLTFDLSMHDILVCWQAGACLYVPSMEQKLFMVDFVKKYQITVWFSVPSVAALLSDYGLLKPNSLPSLRLSLFCGEALASSVAKKWRIAAPNSRLDNLYGPTEATIAISQYQYLPLLSSGLDSVVPIGKVFEDHEYRIVDQEFNPVPFGSHGELLLAGAQISPGYLEGDRKQAFIDYEFAGAKGQRWYRTGDLVKEDLINGLCYLGRIDQQVKVRGYRVEISEVEQAITNVCGFQQVAVVPGELDAGGNAHYLVAFVVGDINTALLKTLANEQLPDYMRLEKIMTIETLPLNANGKVDYKVLSQRVNYSLQPISA